MKSEFLPLPVNSAVNRMVNLTVAKKKELNLQKRLILLDDLSISMIGSDFTRGEVPPHPYPPPPRGEGWVGEDQSCSFLCNVKVNSVFLGLPLGPASEGQNQRG